jgi:predicted amidophosphoribosyltransferase
VALISPDSISSARLGAATLVGELVALLAPPSCPACHAALDGSRLRLCPACASALPWLPRRCCPACGLPGHRGGRCPARGAAFARAWAPLAYDGVARELVGALKFRGALPLASLMAAHIAANLPLDLRPRSGLHPGEPLAIVPVPPQRARHRRRGFDPAQALARAVSRRLDVPLTPCLRRRDREGRQVGSGRMQRRRPGRLAIEPRAAAPVRALLLDDVHTTGATLEACALVLRAGGCREVTAVTYARTL